MRLTRRTVKRGRVEIIPMIDTILILLIFYMSFSTFTQKERRIDAKLPLVVVDGVPSTKVPLDITIHVKDKNDMSINGAPGYTAELLRDQMLSFAAVGQEATIVIEADPETHYDAVIAALDACALANLTKVAFRPLPEKPAATP